VRKVSKRVPSAVVRATLVRVRQSVHFRAGFDIKVLVCEE